MMDGDEKPSGYKITDLKHAAADPLEAWLDIVALRATVRVLRELLDEAQK